MFENIQRMNDWQKWVVSFVLTAVLIAICYAWLDRPIALALHHYASQFDGARKILFRVPEVTAPLGALVLLTLAFRVLTRRPLSRLQSVMLVCALSFFVAEGLKTFSKYVFGRSWPESWMGPHVSFIRDGTYGFHLFHGGPAYTAFPLGHIAAACAVTSVLWICYPKYRTVYLLFVLAASLALLGSNSHFLSDIIAGIFLGASTGWIATVMWKMGVYPA